MPEAKRPWYKKPLAVGIMSFIAGGVVLGAGGSDDSAGPTPAPSVTVTATMTPEPVVETVTATPEPVVETVTATPDAVVETVTASAENEAVTEEPSSEARFTAQPQGTEAEQQDIAPAVSQQTNDAEASSSVYYKNCDAVRAAGAAPIRRGDPGYDTHLDGDGDGVGCERS